MVKISLRLAPQSNVRCRSFRLKYHRFESYLTYVYLWEDIKRYLFIWGNLLVNRYQVTNDPSSCYMSCNFFHNIPSPETAGLVPEYESNVTFLVRHRVQPGRIVRTLDKMPSSISSFDAFWNIIQSAHSEFNVHLVQ